MKELRNFANDELESVNHLIVASAESHAELIPSITNYLTNSGGKRLRPLLTCAVAKLLGVTDDSHIKLGTAVEYLHTATLLHDDVIDESEMRRGQKTANNVWGNKATILVGDYLLSHAFKMMVDAGSMKALALLADSAKIITESEVWQLELVRKLSLSNEAYIKLITGKTAVLFAAACSVGAIAMKLPESISDALYEYGLNFGISFQIIDDLLDYSASSAIFGKNLGNDLKEGKVTLPFILAYQDAGYDDRKILENAVAQKGVTEVVQILSIFEKYDVFNRSRAVAKQYADIALEKLRSIEGYDLSLLENLLEEQISRQN